MRYLHSALAIATVASLAVPLTCFASAAPEVNLAIDKAIAVAEWQPLPGDSLLIDTKRNIGALVHADGRFMVFVVATGQRRTVRYIGRTYNAATPNRRWSVLSRESKGRSVTFGPEGTFLRLFIDGNLDDQTPYGIHTHLYADVMLAREDRFASMGCVIVSEAMLAMIERTYAVNEGKIDVTTQYGFLADDVVKLATIGTSPAS